MNIGNHRRHGKLAGSIEIAVENLFDTDKYLDCNRCHKPLIHCNCKCPYCGQRDKCECALFDAATGG